MPAADETPEPAEMLTLSSGERLAYLRARPGSAGAGPGVVWLGGFRSDMRGQKAERLHRWAQRKGAGFVRFDYRGHGESSGRFENYVIGSWRDDALAVVDRLTEGPQVLVGSSMGAWIALLVALARPHRIAGLVLVAPAPDFVSRLMAPQFTPDIRTALAERGYYDAPSAYGPEPYRITRALVEDGERLALTHAPIAFSGPVRILQGMADADVPWRHAVELIETLTSGDVAATLVKSGDHRLSDPENLHRLEAMLEDVCAAAG